MLPQARRRLALCQTRLSSARWQSLCSTSLVLSGSMPPPTFAFAAPHPSVVSTPPLPATPCTTRLPSQVLSVNRHPFHIKDLSTIIDLCGVLETTLAPSASSIRCRRLPAPPAQSSTEQATSVSWPCPSTTPSPLAPISPALASCPPSTSSNGSCLASTLLLSSFADALHVECHPPSALARNSHYLPVPQRELSPHSCKCIPHSLFSARTSPSILTCLRQCCN